MGLRGILMAVIPGSSDIPAGAFSATGLQPLQDVTEQTVKDAVKSKMMPSINSARESLFGSLLSGLFGGFLDVLNGLAPPAWLPDTAVRAAQHVKDGQESLNSRADLLSPLLDYCSAYAPPNDRDHARFGAGRMPFTQQIGPSRNVQVTSDGRLKLLDRGLWDIRAQVVVSWISVFGNADIRVGVRVLRPDGSVFSQQTMIEKTTNITSFTVVSSVVVDEPGYFVEVYVEQLDSGRGVFGGPKWSRLTVQHISRDLKNNTGAESSTSDPSQTGSSESN